MERSSLRATWLGRQTSEATVVDCSLWVDAQSQSIEISWDYIYRIFVDGKVEHDDEVSGGMKVLGCTVVRRGFRFTSQATTFPHWMGLSLRDGLSADLSC